MNFEIPGIYFFLIDIFIPVVAVCGCLSAILFMKEMHERAAQVLSSESSHLQPQQAYWAAKSSLFAIINGVVGDFFCLKN